MELSQYQCCLGPEVDDVYEEGNHNRGHQRCKVCHSWRNRSCSLQCWGCSWYWETFTGNNTLSIIRKKLMKIFDKKKWWKQSTKNWWKKANGNICHIPFAELSILDVVLALSIPWWRVLWEKKVIKVFTRNSITIFSPRITDSNIFIELD